MGLIRKIQEKPKSFRKKVFWLIMILIIIGAIFLFVQKMKQITSSFPENINFSQIQNEATSGQTNIEENISEIKKGLGIIKGLFEELKEMPSAK